MNCCGYDSSIRSFALLNLLELDCADLNKEMSHHCLSLRNSLILWQVRSIEIRLECRCLQKMFHHLKLLCLLFMGPTLGFDTKQRNSFLIKFGVFYHKSKIRTVLFIVKYDKITLFDEFLVLLGPIISRFLACSNEEKINKNNKGCCSSPISMCCEYGPRCLLLFINDNTKIISVPCHIAKRHLTEATFS